MQVVILFSTVVVVWFVDEHALQPHSQDSTVRTIFSETSVWDPVLNCLTVVFYYLPIFILAAFCTWAVIPFNLENFPSHSVEPFFHSNICEQFGLQVADFIAKFLISDCPVLECLLFQVSEASEGGMDSVEAALDEVPLSDLESRDQTIPISALHFSHKQGPSQTERRQRAVHGGGLQVI